MGLSFYGVRDLTIEGLTVEETGGDGLYLQDTDNVTVRDATFMRNYRQVVRLPEPSLPNLDKHPP
jgi:hypothetical protein